MTEVTTIDKLKPDTSNPRKHDERNIDSIIDSLKRVGAARSIVIDDQDVILAGNGVIRAAAKVGIKNVRIIEADGDEIIAVRRSNLTPEAKIALKYYDNRTAELASWDEAQVAADVMAGLDTAGLWEQEELDAILQGAGEGIGAERETGKGELLALAEVTIDNPRHEVSKGDVWQLGHHTLLCLDVFEDWGTWAGYLRPGSLFIPYPGPFVALTVKADKNPLVMVQPDPYIAGHVLDRWEELKGSEGISKGARP